MSFPAPTELPEVVLRHNAWLFKWFSRYCVRLVRKRFEAARVLRDAAPGDALGGTHPDAATVVVLNHPAWWDPMSCVVAAHAFFPKQTHFAPIDAEMLGDYFLFDRLGFFGVEQDSPRGGVAFLRTAERILADPQRMLWVTAQGGFTDVRDRPVTIMPGVPRLLDRLGKRGQPARVLPMAVEYPFWMQSKPEMMLAFGQAVDVTSPAGGALQPAIEASLTQAMDRLAEAVRSREAERFEALNLGGKRSSGVGGAYDASRRAVALAQGKTFHASHRKG